MRKSFWLLLGHCKVLKSIAWKSIYNQIQPYIEYGWSGAIVEHEEMLRDDGIRKELNICSHTEAAPSQSVYLSSGELLCSFQAPFDIDINKKNDARYQGKEMILAIPLPMNSRKQLTIPIMIAKNKDMYV